VVYRHPPQEIAERKPSEQSTLKMPTLAELLASAFREPQHLLFPWLREQESCMVYAATGVGKSLFALSAAIAIAGRGEFLGWKPDTKVGHEGWKVLYVDGEMHIGDVRDRAAMLLDAVPGVDRELVGRNLTFLARQHQEPSSRFPLITEENGMEFVLERVREGQLDLVILDNFSTLGEVEDENSAASFNAIQAFLLRLKTQGVATILVHHANKTGEDFRGSSKLAATFETIIKLEPDEQATDRSAAQFRARFQKVRAGGSKRAVPDLWAKLKSTAPEKLGDPTEATWEYLAILDRMGSLRERLEAGEFTTQAEIATAYGKTPTTAGNWVKKGVEVGLWTKEDMGRWFAKGKRLRTSGKTQAPDQPDMSWEEEVLEDKGPRDPFDL
jgi:KaiC/GvpD/RAD55 family RecA-like ATPase